MSYTYTTTASTQLAAHADHNWEEWHGYLACDLPEPFNGDDTGLCCHTCALVIVERPEGIGPQVGDVVRSTASGSLGLRRVVVRIEGDKVWSVLKGTADTSPYSRYAQWDSARNLRVEPPVTGPVPCSLHLAYDADYCPVCGTARVIL